MESSEVISTLAFTLVPGVIILGTMVFGLVHQRKAPPATEPNPYDARLYRPDPMVMCLADVSVSLQKGPEVIS
jgi:hypothetical protein